MRKWLTRTIVACLLLALLAFLSLRWFDREPEYKGRRLSQWVDDLRTGTGETRQQAAEALRNLGPEGVPYLSGELTNPPSPVQKAAKLVSNHVPENLKRPLRRIYDPSSEVGRKLAVLNALQTMGTNGAGAAFAVGQILQQSHVGLSSAAGQALARMGTNALPPLIAALDNGNYATRSSACDALSMLHTNAAPAVPRLLRIARDEIGPIASKAIYTLSRVGTAAVPELAGLVTNTNAIVRSQALYALAVIGPNAREAEEIIAEAVDDPVPEVRQRAVQALSTVNYRSPWTKTIFPAALNDADASVRAAGAAALGNRPRLAREHLARLEELLNDPSPDVRQKAAFAIGQTGEGGINQLPRLVEMASAETNKPAKLAAETAARMIRESQKLSESRRAATADHKR